MNITYKHKENEVYTRQAGVTNLNINLAQFKGEQRPLRSYRSIKLLGESTLQPSLNTSLVTARMSLQLDSRLSRSQSLDR